MQKIRVAEWVFPGHPDKLSDAVADSIVERAAFLERESLVGVEVAVNRANVTVTGRVASRGFDQIGASKLVREVYKEVGYGSAWNPAPEDLHVAVDLCLGNLLEGEGEFRKVSDDQTISIGYANAIEATNHLPLEHYLVRNIAKRIYEASKREESLFLGPDGKVIVYVAEEERNGLTQYALAAVSASLQQANPAALIELNRFVRSCVKAECETLSASFPQFSGVVPEAIVVNGAGNFAVGGPEGDNGLSGKKLVCDAYGPRVPIGGGAWSGKDFFKADRAGGLFARKIAKTLVFIGMAKEATVMLSFFPGDEEARVLSVVNEKGESLDCRKILSSMDLTLAYSGTHFAVSNLKNLARWGHFFNPGLPWETFQIR